jgi:hypothetical protein
VFRSRTLFGQGLANGGKMFNLGFGCNLPQEIFDLYFSYYSAANESMCGVEFEAHKLTGSGFHFLCRK